MYIITFYLFVNINVSRNHSPENDIMPILWKLIIELYTIAHTDCRDVMKRWEKSIIPSASSPDAFSCVGKCTSWDEYEDALCIRDSWKHIIRTLRNDDDLLAIASSDIKYLGYIYLISHRTRADKSLCTDILSELSNVLRYARLLMCSLLSWKQSNTLSDLVTDMRFGVSHRLMSISKLSEK